LAVSGQETFRPLRGPYMGQEAALAPEIFLPGKISSGADEGCSIFYGEARSFLWRTDRSRDVLLMLLEDRDGRWQPPRPVGLFEDGSDVQNFTLAPSGDLIYATSEKKVSGAGGSNIWAVQFEAGEWQEPHLLSPSVNSDWNEVYASATRDGDLYFSRSNPADIDEVDLYYAASKNGSLETAVRLRSPLNSPSPDYDPFIAADGSYLIFSSRRLGGHGEGDLYISYRQEDGNWRAPHNLGPGINSSAEERNPSVTSDGLYFFFTSNRIEEPRLPPGVPPARSMPGNGSRDIYWIKAGFIESGRGE